MRHSLFGVPIVFLLLFPAAHSEQSSLPGCEAPAALRKVIKDQLHSPEFRRLPYADQPERKRLVLSGLMTRYSGAAAHPGVTRLTLAGRAEKKGHVERQRSFSFLLDRVLNMDETFAPKST